MSYYRTCPYCGANLDPGERCDCRDNEKAAADAANIDGGWDGIENDNTLFHPYSTKRTGRNQARWKI